MALQATGDIPKKIAESIAGVRPLLFIFQIFIDYRSICNCDQNESNNLRVSEVLWLTHFLLGITAMIKFKAASPRKTMVVFSKRLIPLSKGVREPSG